MLFHIQCLDRADAGTTRPDTRPVHLEYLQKFLPQILTAGPLLTPEGKPFGSAFVVDFADEAAARKFAAEDPYAVAGLFASVTISRFRQVYPDARE